MDSKEHFNLSSYLYQRWNRISPVKQFALIIIMSIIVSITVYNLVLKNSDIIDNSIDRITAYDLTIFMLASFALIILLAYIFVKLLKYRIVSSKFKNNAPIDIKVVYILDMMLAKKTNDTIKSLFGLTSILMITIAYNGNVHFAILNSSIIITIGLLLLNYLCYRTRIKLGYYGSTSYEVREILNYIISNSNTINYDDENGTRFKVFPEIELSQNTVFDGIPANVGGRQ